MPEPVEDFLPTRTSLLRRLKQWEDQESWRDFFDTYWKLIYSAAVKAGLNDAEAQDVVQDTVIAVAKKIEDFKYDPAVDSFKGWLLYLTRKRVALHYRKRERDRGGPFRVSARNRIETKGLSAGCWMVVLVALRCWMAGARLLMNQVADGRKFQRRHSIIRARLLRGNLVSGNFAG